MAGGGHETDRHYHDTIETKRSLEELSHFVTKSDLDKLALYSRGRPYAIWGAVPGESNIRNWNAMEEGDYVMVYRQGKIILAAEIGMKLRSPILAEHLWRKDAGGKTWEYLYFMINDSVFDLPMSKLNKYLGYEEDYKPRGFMAIKQEKVDQALSTYGDLVSLLSKLQKDEEVKTVEEKEKTIKTFREILDEKIEKAPTEHTEMQWRLIRMGNRSHFDVWVPEADKNKEWNGEKFSGLVIEKFHETIDVPTYVKNIDTVWKLGHSIKSAFEIENSTSIYSGILRLSDLRALAPNSNYPLFIVAQKEKKSRVFEQLRRPTFSNDYLALDRAVKYLSYDAIRDLDEKMLDSKNDFNMEWLTQRAEAVPTE